MSSNSSSRKIGGAWSELQFDLCGTIIDSINPLDVMNFSATCSSWSSTYCRLKKSLVETGQPTLLTSRPDHDGTKVEEGLAEGTFGLHDICQVKSFCIHKKCMENNFWVGGKEDWLVLTDNRCNMKLVNLISGDLVRLPSLSTINGAQINEQYGEVGIELAPVVRLLRRVVLCQTPSSRLGHIAVALFDDGLLAFTTKGDRVWKLFKHPTEWAGCTPYFPEVFMDAILHNGKVVAVDEEGYLFSWDMNNHRDFPLRIEKPDIPCVEGCNDEVFYLAKSPLDELILICLHGHGPRSYKPCYRVLGSEHKRFEHIGGMTMHKFDDSDSAWHCISVIGHGHSLFLGLNYPFSGTWLGIEPNSVYVADMLDNDMMIIGMGHGIYTTIEKEDFPVEEGARLLDGHSMRTPMWFRPTRPSPRQ